MTHTLIKSFIVAVFLLLNLSPQWSEAVGPSRRSDKQVMTNSVPPIASRQRQIIAALDELKVAANANGTIDSALLGCRNHASFFFSRVRKT